MRYWLLPFCCIHFLSCNEPDKSPVIPPGGKTIAQDTVLTPPDTIVPAPVPEKDSVYAFTGGNYGKWGFKNKRGETMVTPKFDVAGNFAGKYAPVILKDQHGFCDTSGKMVIKLKAGLSFVTKDNEMSGERFFTAQDDGLIGVKNGEDLYGYVNDSGKLVIPCTFNYAEGFSEGMAIVEKDGLYGFIDKTGKIKINYQYEMAFGFKQNRACVTIDGKRGFIDRKGQLVIPAVYDQAYYFSEGLANVTIMNGDNRYFYIDTTGKTIIKGPYEETGAFERGQAQVSQGNKCWIIDKTGKKIKSLKYPCFAGC